jgi:DNA-binding transcriptional LysR family regulator
MLAWDDVRILLAVHRSGSHAAAGRALGVVATTVGRRISALEEDLGARLFERTSSGLSLTPAGRRLMLHAERAEAEILSGERAARGADLCVEGEIRLTAPDGLMTYVLVPRLLPLRLMHPGLEIELRADNHPLDLSRREADVAVRLFRPKQPALLARRLGRLPYGLFASESYLSRCRPPRSLSDLSDHQYLGFDSSLKNIPEARWLALHVPGLRVALRATSTTALVTACATGHGIAALPVVYAEPERRLVPVLPGVELPAREVWGVCHTDLRDNARVRLLLDWAQQALAEVTRARA